MTARAQRVFLMFAWPLWARNKPLYITSFSLLAFLTVGAYAIEDESIRHGFVFLYALTLLGLVNTVAGPFVWGFPNAPQTLKPSFPKGACTMPASDAELVLFPLLLAFSSFLVLWTLFVCCVVQPLHISVGPVLHWPHKEQVEIGLLAYPLCFAAAWVSLAVLSQWVAPLAGILPPVGIFGLSSVFMGFVSDVAVIRASLVVCLLCVACSFVACNRVRHGYHPSGVTEFFRKTTVAVQRRRINSHAPFRNSWFAQVWFECGPYYCRLTMLSLCAAPFYVISGVYRITPLTPTDVIDRVSRTLASPSGFWHIKMLDLMPTLMFLPFIPVFLVSVSGLPFYEAHKGDRTLVRNDSLDRLSAIRPITTCRIVGTRLVLNAGASVLFSFVLIYVLKPLLYAPAVEDDRQGGFYDLFAFRMGHRAELCVALAVLFLPLVAWSITCGNPLRYYARKWMLWVAGFVLLEAGPISSLASLSMKDHRPLTERLAPFLSGLVVCFLLAKVLLGVKGWRRLRVTNLVSAETLRTSALIWIAVAAVTIGLFSYALAPLTTPLVVSATVLVILPVNRIIWQILGLDRTRHLANKRGCTQIK